MELDFSLHTAALKMLNSNESDIVRFQNAHENEFIEMTDKPAKCSSSI